MDAHDARFDMRTIQCIAIKDNIVNCHRLIAVVSSVQLADNYWKAHSIQFLYVPIALRQISPHPPPEAAQFVYWHHNRADSGMSVVYWHAWICHTFVTSIHTCTASVGHWGIKELYVILMQVIIYIYTVRVVF